LADAAGAALGSVRIGGCTRGRVVDRPGHGRSQVRLGAAWVPADSEADAESEAALVAPEDGVPGAATSEDMTAGSVATGLAVKRPAAPAGSSAAVAPEEDAGSARPE
jgi:hypothetical protein